MPAAIYDGSMTQMRTRRSHEEGHTRKFLVVIDDSPECLVALEFAAKRAERSKGGLTLIFVVEPGDFQHWLGVEDIMRAEARDEAQEVLERFAAKARETSDIEPELVIREGKKAEEVRALIEQDEDIAVLVLGASESAEGPGPLVSSIAAKGSGGYPVPITIVPGNLSREEIDAIT